MREPPPAAAVHRGMVVAILAMLFFCATDVFNKLLGQNLPVVQILWVRYLAFVPIAAALAWRPHLGVVWRSGRPGLQFLRSVMLIVQMSCFVLALTLLPLADVQAIAASAPLLVTALSVPLLGEAVGWRRWSAVGVGFLGMLLIVRPGLEETGWPTLLVLAGTTLWAIYQIMLRLVGRHDGAATTALWSATVGAIVTSAIAPFQWQAPTATGWLLLAAVALTGSLGHTLYSRAYVLAPAAILQPLTYLMLVFATLFGWLVFGDFPDAWTIAGACLIVLSGLYTFHRERVRGVAAGVPSEAERP